MMRADRNFANMHTWGPGGEGPTPSPRRDDDHFHFVEKRKKGNALWLVFDKCIDSLLFLEQP
jgi:hypothetical protein